MGTITTKSWCAVDGDSRAYTGSKAEIVYSIFTITWMVDTGAGRSISAKVSKSRQDVTLPIYSHDFSPVEVDREIIKDLFAKLPRLGFTIYRQLEGF